MRLLVVEDDVDVAAGLQESLSAAGFVCDWASTAREAQTCLNTGDYEAVVLDLGLPDRNGLHVLRQWRHEGCQLPVLILTARDSWPERVNGLQAGADDYLGKPFHPEELQARLQALIRRSHGHSAAQLQQGPLRLDLERQELELDGHSHALSGQEFRLLRYLMLHPGHVLSRQQLLDQLYDWEAEIDSNVIEVYILRLRRKLGADWIQTRRGQGYVFGVPS
ncbi:MAG: response regulator [Candidatus Sericytochromatia bacterium]